MSRAVDRVAPRRAVFVATLCLVAAASCAPTLNVETGFDREASFRDYRQWAFIDSPEGRGGTLGGLDPSLRGRVEEAIRSELKAAKFKDAGSGTPDFYVAYHGGRQDREIVQSYGYSTGLWFSHGGDVHLFGSDTRLYTEGTLVVDIVDAKSRELVWRGVATDIVTDKGDATEKAVKAVKEMLGAFPPHGG